MFIHTNKTQEEIEQILETNAKRLGKKVSRSKQSMARVGKIFTHCKRGHELAGDNLGLYTQPDGYTERYCKICTRNARRAKTLRGYGLTTEDYDRMLKNQGGGCGVCGSTNPGEKVDAVGNKSFHIDHNHNCCSGKKSCGKCVRMLLCSKCNAALGYAEDSPERLRALADYLESFK